MFVDIATRMAADADGKRGLTNAPMNAGQEYVNRVTNDVTRNKRTLTFTDPSTLLVRIVCISLKGF